MSGIEIATIAGTAITVGDVALVAGTAVSALGAMSAGSGQAGIANFNAKVAQNEAIAARQAAEAEEDLQRERTKRILGTQRAAAGASGIDPASGSVLLATAQSAEDAELDALTIRHSGSVAEARARSEAAASRLEARAFRSRGRSKAAGTLLTGLSSVGAELG